MVTGIKMISQQQVINSNTMVLNGLTAAQIPSQEAPVKRATAASDARRVSFHSISFNISPEYREMKWLKKYLNSAENQFCAINYP